MTNGPPLTDVAVIPIPISPIYEVTRYETLWGPTIVVSSFFGKIASVFVYLGHDLARITVRMKDRIIKKYWYRSDDPNFQEHAVEYVNNVHRIANKEQHLRGV